MHSIVVTSMAAVFAVLQMFSIQLTNSSQILWLVVTVCLVGVPHGGLDHWAGRSLFFPCAGKLWLAQFMLCYLSVGFIVVLGWLVSPLVTILIFFVLSAWHFGIEEDVHAPPKSWFDKLSRFAIGGMVIWIPATAQPEAVQSIMSSLVPNELRNQAIIACDITTISAWLFVPVVAVSWVNYLNKEPLIALRLAAFAILFATASPLISFIAYFCGWHSIRGLRQLRAMHSGTAVEFVKSILPLSLGAIALAIPIYWLSGQYVSLSQNLLRTTFVALSAIAIPHLMLHVAANASRVRQDDGVYEQVGGALQ